MQKIVINQHKSLPPSGPYKKKKKKTLLTQQGSTGMYNLSSVIVLEDQDICI